MKTAFVHLAALAAFISLPGIASAQVQNVDPDTGSQWQQPADDQPAETQPATPPASDDWTPLGTAEEEAAAADATPVEAVPPTPQQQTNTTTARGETVPR